MKTTETYYQVRLTERISEDYELRRVMLLKFSSLRGAKSYASELLNLIAYGNDGCCDKTTDLYLVTYKDPKSSKVSVVCFAEVVDQDGNVQQI